jgi:hypothetical protein
MTKSLSEIKKENRKFILEATGEYKDELELLKQQEHQIYHEIISKSFYSKPLTLSRVLLASIKSAKCMDCFEHKNNKYCSSEWHVDREENLSRIRNFILDNWKNLELETLEEQTEQTQRKINKLFND